MVEITDQDNAEAWLKKQPVEVCVALAARSALRALPGIAATERATLGDIALPVLRAILTSAVAAKMPTADVKKAASFAASSASSAASSAASFAASAAAAASFAAFSAAAYAAAASSAASSAASFAASAAAAAFSAFSWDATSLTDLPTGGQVFDTTLWPNNAMPEAVDANLAALRAFWETDLKTWGFWAHWYHAFLRGEPVDWDLQGKIAHIPNDDWEKGSEHIAAIIRRLELQSRTRVAPPLILNTAKQKFEIAEDVTLPADLLSFARDRAALALDTALETSTGNGFDAQSYEAVAIRQAIARHPNSGSILAGAFYEASLGLSKHIGDRYPDDPPLVNLKNALYAVSEEICELDDAARQRCKRLASLQPAPPDVVKIDEFAEVADVVTEFADETATEVIKSDADMLQERSDAPKWIKARFANYVTTIVLYIDKAQKGFKRYEWLSARLDDLMKWLKAGD